MKCFKLLITLSVSIFIFTFTAIGCDVKLKNTAIVSSKWVTLKTIAINYPENLANTILLPAPFINNSITLSKSYINYLLKQKGINVSLCGAKSVKVTSKAFLITKEMIQNTIGHKCTILNKLPIKLPFGNYKLKLNSIRYRNNLSFYTIEIYKDSKLYKKITITTKRDIVGKIIPIAKRDIAAGEIINASDITFKRISKIPSNVLVDRSFILNRVAISFIPKGKPFSLANTRRFKPVKLGDLVKVEVISGNIRINTVAKALRGGYKGDIIPIMYLSSKRITAATVIGNKQVVVQ